MSESNAVIRKQFGAHAADYATSATHAQGASLARLIELTDPQNNWTMLDVSTGAGHTAFTFALYVAKIIAVDLTPEMLEQARKLAQERKIKNIEFREADAQQLPFTNNEFDLVTNRIALHHYADARKAITEMARVCKVGGVVALVDNIVPPDKVTAGWINHFEKMRDPSHNWCYPLPRLEAMFADAGLKVEHSEKLKKEIELDAWAERMGASADLKKELRTRLDDAPQEVLEWFMPRHDGKKIFFLLREAIILGRKE
ncbi:MAG: methyltransferase domain-containing protein [Chloroflexi bacterium]|nr:methyltransferase domain-containing protein [Chloroflexota bacterium]